MDKSFLNFGAGESEGAYSGLEHIRNDNRRRLYFAALLALIFFVVGAIAYHYIEGWDWITSLYFISATMTTVGYGDVTPKTTVGRLITVFYMWVGISIGFYLIYSFSKFRELELDALLKRAMGIKTHLHKKPKKD
jgi:voltage-gated potassium channel Kch